MINRYVEATDEYIKQLEHEIDNLNAINEEHKKINGKLREEYNKIQNLYESVFAESKKQKEVIDRTINAIDLVIELIKQQPMEDDRWILDRLNGFKIILKIKRCQNEYI